MKLDNKNCIISKTYELVLKFIILGMAFIKIDFPNNLLSRLFDCKVLSVRNKMCVLPLMNIEQ